MTTAASPNADGIRRRTRRARCEECGDDDVVALCCNCDAFLCGRHNRVADLEELRRMANNVLRRGVHRTDSAPDALDRVPAPAEYLAGPDDGDDQPTDTRGEEPTEPKAVQRRHFCSDCVPIGHAHDVHVLGAVGGSLLGLTVQTISSALGSAVIAASIGWLCVRVGLGVVRLRLRGRRYSRLLFLAPRIRKLELTETVEGRCELDEEHRETLTVDKVHAEIDVELRWTSSQAAAAERYRRKTPTRQRALLRAEAGHLVLRGAGQLDLTPPAGCEAIHPALISLRPFLADHEMLSHPDGHGDTRWDFTLTYRPEQPAKGSRLPVWVTASFSPDSGGRALDLHVQWNTAARISDPDDGPELTAKELTQVTLEVPGAWGPVQFATLDRVEQTLVGNTVDGTTRIQWKKPEIPAESRGSRDLSVSFSQPIDPSTIITGDVELTFAEAISGITGLHKHAPGGGRRRDGARPKIKTKTWVHFALNLEGIRHQESRTVPDAAVNPDDTEARKFADTRPDEYLVVGLVQQLAEQRYLIKSVVEHPPRPGRGVGLQHRVWDVTGRRYRSVYPIDFRITVTGDEAEAGSSAPSSTSIRLIVRGVRASETMEEEIVKAYEEIWARIETAIRAAETGADGNRPRLPSEPLSKIGEHAARLEATLLSIQSIVDEHQRNRRMGDEIAQQLHDAIELGRAGSL